jgi:hypothetical protein
VTVLRYQRPASIRSLPLRLLPTPGEALDSWLEAIAHRCAIQFGDVLTATGIRDESSRRRWLVSLLPTELDTLTSSTGVGEDELRSMTLSHYDGTAVAVDHSKRVLKASFPWGRRAGSRYCPHCLRDNGGRWKLAWRLNWTFACLQHCCLLADTCSSCGSRQRQHSHGILDIPQPGYCPRLRHDIPTKTRRRCNAELSAAKVLLMPSTHPVLSAQRIINDIRSGEPSKFGVYQTQPAAARDVMADMKALATWVISAVDQKELQPSFPGEIADALARHRASLDWPYGMHWNSVGIRPEVLDSAIGITMALKVLGASGISTASSSMQHLAESARRGSPYRKTVSPNGEVSPVLAAIEEIAFKSLSRHRQPPRCRTDTNRRQYSRSVSVGLTSR